MVSSNSTDLPTFADVEDAARQIDGHARRTPLLENTVLNDQLGFRLLVKPECLQRTGSFKFRGAYNKISRIPEDERANGVVAYSSGNHAQGVAAAAAMLGIDATIIMPADAPKAKIDNTRALGGEVLPYDRYRENREEIGLKLQQDRGATLVKPYDDPMIIAGQGTVGLEIAQQSAELGIEADAVYVCVGGGGLSSGTALAIANTLKCDVYGVEPEEFNDTQRSYEAGERVGHAEGAQSICDALLAPTPGEITFALNKELLSGVHTVSDQDALSAMKTALFSLKIAVEPGGAVAFAAAIKNKADLAGKTVVAVCSGGNVDPEMLARAVET